MRASLLWMLLSAALVSVVYTYSAGTCDEDADECFFTLNVTSKLTMMDGGKLVKATDGKLHIFDDWTANVSENVIQADGYYQNTRLVIVANDQLPGPKIEVFQGQRLSVTVTNHLGSEGVTLHWHGVIQTGTNFMDGVAFVNQCPILPGQSFTYTFVVQTPGTDFYHAHIGAQRTQGLFGPLITKRKSKDRLPIDKVKDYTMTVNDWNHDYDSNTGHLKAKGIYDSHGVKFNALRSRDDSQYSNFQWHSGLINGKGRYHNASGIHNEAPLTVFNISKGETVRFRVISAGSMFPLRINIDRHQLRMISSDGYEFEEYPVESFILSPGERFDFLVTANQDAGSYWIYAETTEVLNATTSERPDPRHRAEAILQYAENPLPNSDYDKHVFKSADRSYCTPTNTCIILNCPFGDVLGPKEKCKYLTDLESTENQTVVKDSYFHEAFYNYAFIGGGSINGRRWKYPSFPAASQKAELVDVDTLCDECTTGIESCTCTHTDDLIHNEQYQFVFINSGKGSGVSHPAHLHGHNFQVVKQGFYGKGLLPFSGNHITPNVTCLDGTVCNVANWTDPDWSGRKLNNQIKDNPVLKDTVMVPSGGYTVIRFRANNPGFWFMHCHIELHNLAGMAMMFNEASADQKDPPQSFPICRSFPSKYGLSTNKPTSTTADISGGKISGLLLAMIILAICFFIAFVVTIVFCCCYRRKYYRLNQTHREPLIS